jgi:hypothetical protein
LGIDNGINKCALHGLSNRRDSLEPGYGTPEVVDEVDVIAGKPEKPTVVGELEHAQW